ncbi:hypothetical protein OG577_03970 [Streptomyces canus]
MDGALGDTVRRGQVGDPDRSRREVGDNPRLELTPEQSREVIVNYLGSARSDDAGDKRKQGATRALDFRDGHLLNAAVNTCEKTQQQARQRVAVISHHRPHRNAARGVVEAQSDGGHAQGAHGHRLRHNKTRRCAGTQEDECPWA